MENQIHSSIEYRKSKNKTLKAQLVTEKGDYMPTINQAKTSYFQIKIDNSSNIYIYKKKNCLGNNNL